MGDAILYFKNTFLMKNLFTLLSIFTLCMSFNAMLKAQPGGIYEIDCDVATDKSNLVFGYATINGNAPVIGEDYMVFYDSDGFIVQIAGFQAIPNPSCMGQIGFSTNVSGETTNPAIACDPDFGYEDGELITAFIFDGDQGDYYFYSSSMTYDDTPGATATGASADCNDVPDASLLPVRLTAFSAAAVDSKTAYLQWATAREENTSHFEIQHSSTGADWQVIAEVTAIGESEDIQFYEFTHRESLTPVNYYRLRMVDNDGSHLFSGVVIVELKLTGDRKVNIFPNPIAKDADLSIQLRGDWSGDQEITAELYDAQGRLLMKSSGLAGGTSSLALPDGLHGGMYLMRVHQGQHTADQRILVK